MSRCDVCLSDDNEGVSCADCAMDYGPELAELEQLRAEVKRLRALLKYTLAAMGSVQDAARGMYQCVRCGSLSDAPCNRCSP